MRIKTSTILFWIFLVLPALLSAAISMMPKDSADPLIGLSIVSWIISSLYCGIWAGIKSSQTPVARVLLSLVFIAGILVVNCCILAAGCSGKIDFK